jgi:hypothetical protein
MAEKRRPAKAKKMTKAEQSERFKETARKLEADESGKAFERAIDVVLPRRKSNNSVRS